MTIDVVYHVGYLDIDRDARDDEGYLTDAADALHERALKMLRAAELGKVILYQRRCEHGFEYHARAVKGA